jgi:hypothetical protein
VLLLVRRLKLQLLETQQVVVCRLAVVRRLVVRHRQRGYRLAYQKMVVLH